jgi:hypothetical protein
MLSVIIQAIKLRITIYEVEGLDLDPHNKLADVSSLVPSYLLGHLQDPGAADNCSSTGKALKL